MQWRVLRGAARGDFFQLIFFHGSLILYAIRKKDDQKEKDLFMFIVKRITTVGLLGLALSGVANLGCEKFDGPLPYLATRLPQNQMVLISRTDGATPLGAIPIDSLDKILFDETSLTATKNCKPRIRPARR